MRIGNSLGHALILPALVALLFFTAGAAFAVPGCSTSTLDGKYLGNITGTTATAGALAFQALAEFDGNGGATSTATLVTELGGVVSFTSTITYTLDSDCTGTLTSVRSTGQTTHYVMAVVDKGAEIRLLGIDPGVVVTGNFKSAF